MSNQLVKEDSNEGYKKIFPKTFIDSVEDRETKEKLSDILLGFNMYYISYNGNKSETRCKIPSSLRRKGLWITYVLYDGRIVSEWYTGENIDDLSFGNDTNWGQLNNISIVQELGNSKYEVMSQEAITLELNKLKKEIQDLKESML